jgi:hypothetical protein
MSYAHLKRIDKNAKLRNLTILLFKLVLDLYLEETEAIVLKFSVFALLIYDLEVSI